MIIYTITSHAICAAKDPAEDAALEAKVIDIIEGRRPPVLTLPPGRMLVAVEGDRAAARAMEPPKHKKGA